MSELSTSEISTFLQQLLLTLRQAGGLREMQDRFRAMGVISRAMAQISALRGPLIKRLGSHRIRIMWSISLPQELVLN